MSCALNVTSLTKSLYEKIWQTPVMNGVRFGVGLSTQWRDIIILWKSFFSWKMIHWNLLYLPPLAKAQSWQLLRAFLKFWIWKSCVLNSLKNTFITNMNAVQWGSEFQTCPVFYPSQDSSVGSISAWYQGGPGFKYRQGREFFNENKWKIVICNMCNDDWNIDHRWWSKRCPPEEDQHWKKRLVQFSNGRNKSVLLMVLFTENFPIPEILVSLSNGKIPYYHFNTKHNGLDFETLLEIRTENAWISHCSKLLAKFWGGGTMKFFEDIFFYIEQHQRLSFGCTVT